MDTTLTCDLEACLLNVLLTHHDKQSYIFENTEKAFFQEGINAEIYASALMIFEKNGIVTNTDLYEANPEFNNALIAILTQPVAYATLTTHYCKKLYERRLQQLIECAKSEEDLADLKEFKNRFATYGLKVKHISEGADDFELRYKEKQKHAVMTCYGAIDEIIGSFMGGDYIALGGTTGMGKTSIALNIANMLCLQGNRVLYFSLEMPLEQIQNRFVCLTKGLNGLKFRSFGFSENEMKKYREGLSSLKDWNLDVVCDFSLTPDKMKIYIANQKKKGLDFVIVDYLGLMSGYGNKSLYEKMTNLSRQIKLIAVELDVPILCLVQLNRDMKNRQEKRPRQNCRGPDP